MLSALLQYIDIVRGYKESTVIVLFIAGMTWGCGKLYAIRTGTEGVPWYIHVIILLLLSPIIGFWAWYDQKRQHEKEVQNLKDSRQQGEETLHQQIADLKTQLNKEGKREIQLQTVTRILKEGRRILPLYDKREPVSDDTYVEWIKKGTEDLHKFVGESFAVDWGSYEGIPALVHMDSSVHHGNRKIIEKISQRVARLREYLTELGN